MFCFSDLVDKRTIYGAIVANKISAVDGKIGKHLVDS